MSRWKLILIPGTVGFLEAILFGRELQSNLAPWVNLAITLLLWPAAFAIWSADKIVARPFIHGFRAGFFYNIVSMITWYAILYVENAAELRAYFPQANDPVLLFILLGVDLAISSIAIGLCWGSFILLARRIANSRFLRS